MVADLNVLKRELEDIKSLLILLLQKEKIDNTRIADAMGVTPGRISQLINKNKYAKK